MLVLLKMYKTATDIYQMYTTRLHYVQVIAIANLSVVCNVHALYSGAWNFRQQFFTILYLSHPSIGGVKLKRGSKIEW